MSPVVSYRRKPGVSMAPDLSAMSLKQIAEAVRDDRATLADAAEEYSIRQRLGLPVDEPRRK